MNKLENILLSIRPGAEFDKSENFIEDGLLDSFDIVALISELDKTFSISIDGTDIIPENFQNIGSMKILLTRYGVEI